MDLIALKKRMLTAALRAKRGHLGGALSCIDFLAILFLDYKIDPKTFVLSKGHSGIALYAILESLGLGTLDSFCQNESMYTEHPSRSCPGVMSTSGSLGHGVAVAAGMAYAHKLANSNVPIFVLVGDGECMEGAIWESLMFIVKHSLNVIILVDSNGFASTDSFSALVGSSLRDMFEGFSLPVFEADGHNSEAIHKVYECVPNGPAAIIFNTKKGNGISSVENTVHAHHGIPKDIQETIDGLTR